MSLSSRSGTAQLVYSSLRIGYEDENRSFSLPSQVPCLRSACRMRLGTLAMPSAELAASTAVTGASAHSSLRSLGSQRSKARNTKGRIGIANLGKDPLAQ